MGLKLKFGESVSRIDAGMYPAMIKGVAAKKHPTNGEYLNWTLVISGATRDGEPVTGTPILGVNTSTEWTDSPKNKLNKLFKAVGVAVEIGQELDVDQVIGKRLQVVVEDNETEQGIYSKITSFLPSKKRPAPAAAPVQAPAEEEVAEEAPAPVAQPKPAVKAVAKPAVAPKPVVKVAPKPAPVAEEPAAEAPAAEAPAEEAAVSEEELFNFS
jgi:hypothetical protein